MSLIESVNRRILTMVNSLPPDILKRCVENSSDNAHFSLLWHHVFDPIGVTLGSVVLG